jgi:hypothetical protein
MVRYFKGMSYWEFLLNNTLSFVFCGIDNAVEVLTWAVSIILFALVTSTSLLWGIPVMLFMYLKRNSNSKYPRVEFTRNLLRGIHDSNENCGHCVLDSLCKSVELSKKGKCRGGRAGYWGLADKANVKAAAVMRCEEEE